MNQSVVTSESITIDPFISKILQQRPTAPLEKLDEETAAWLSNLREQSASWVSRLKTPSKKHEEWRFTDISELLDLEIVPPQPTNLGEEAVDIIAEAQTTRLVFINGIYAAAVSNTTGLPAGIYVGNLTNLPEAYCKYFRPFLATQPDKEEIFTSLNTASIADVAIIWAAPNAVVEKPIHLSFISLPGENVSFSQPRAWIVAEKNCKLKIIEEYAGQSSYFTNAVTEIWLGENAQINHTRIQQEADNAYHIGKTAVSQARNSHYTLTEINFGAKLSRHNPQINQTGAQILTNLNGLTVANQQQTSDTHSVIHLTQPHGTTNQLHKCIACDRAHTVFNGRVLVPQAAQMTNAAQLNRNLLLSNQARIDTKPELQITADNVKCSHGATVSQLEAEEIFYLQSRGLTAANARNLLIDAFAAEIIQRIPVKSLQSKITQALEEKTK
ncbi:MAG: Fe-S cluster assembly protein SufD [Cyanobacteria bacterium J083]|nr:MAG: Fe-S cluster assembly protein SufD [Cyanobacteria bacterium J083]